LAIQVLALSVQVKLRKSEYKFPVLWPGLKSRTSTVWKRCKAHQIPVTSVLCVRHQIFGKTLLRTFELKFSL